MVKNEKLCATFIEGAQIFLPRSNSSPRELSKLYKVKIEVGKAFKLICFQTQADGENKIDVLLM